MYLELREGFGLCHPIVALFRLVQAPLALAKTLIAVDDVLNHRPLGVRKLLRYGGDAQLRRAFEFASISAERALDECEQAGFAAAVATDDADLFSAKDTERSLFEQGFRPPSQENIAQVNHDASLR